MAETPAETPEIPGARARLGREAEDVCAYLRSLAARLTPGQVPEFTVAGDPFMDTGTEPATYLYLVWNRVRARDTYDAELAARAAALLAADGWATTEETPEPHPASWGAVVTGLRDGRKITVSISRSRSEVMYQGQTPPIALYEDVPWVRPDPVVTPETLPPGCVLCEECGGLGWCPVCEGRGRILGGDPGWSPEPRDPNRLGRCTECFGERVCPFCRGGGTAV
ncbi:hypothetical protein [Streptomyces sp. 6N223]|uniref:hypothetical protein n=1 Tax=Streptomyces sp. 6N223 TaxID=3457412 RepID=UPI003FD0B7C9